MPSLKYLPEALFFLGVAIGIFKWTMRNALEAMPPSDADESPELELPHMLPALLARGVLPPSELGRLTPAERVALYRAVFDGREAEAARGPGPASGWRAACPRCDALLGAGGVPVGFMAHCPVCGTELPKPRNQ